MRPPHLVAAIVLALAPFDAGRAPEFRERRGNDECVSVESVGFGVRFLYDVLKYAQ